MRKSVLAALVLALLIVPSLYAGRARRPFFATGPVSRFDRFGGGVRVWIGGVRHPFFIPQANIAAFPRFRVGLSLRLGGYYNPRGWYDYTDGADDDDRASDSATLRGVVEGFDDERGTVLIRDGEHFISAAMRGDEPRFRELRIADYVELSGEWTRIHTFDAYKVEVRDQAGYRYRP